MSKSDLFDVNGQVAVITGGAGVLCAEMALTLGRAGAKIALLDIGEDAMSEVSHNLDNESIDNIAIKTDVLDKSSIEEAAHKTISRFGRVDILINGAGGNKPTATTSPEKPFFDLPQDAIKWVFDLNFLGTFMPCQVFGKYFAEQQSGNIINVSSMNAFTPLTKIPAYSAAKAAVSNFTQWLAVHMSQNYSTDIRVNGIAPGFLLTDQNRFLLTNKDDGSLTDRGQTIVDHTPAARFGNPEDLVSTVVWLVAPSSQFVNGIVVPVDGGFSAFSGV
ncbi:SDR family oxidoreductase [Natronogracilivirga saccharolytica]|uniref:SDR family oxidoreductase n=1 Tax=Natronogracilivirga saccharolytica TaxID=2812953 RepID=A0A8J7RVV0_9BACT|nr:SDR family oxidoreductase [Natronogracilivirga saccharolytica]MBP3193887.1 SDR family oxidoreductase [Natronogracilivirga saccharolytica]